MGSKGKESESPSWLDEEKDTEHLEKTGLLEAEEGKVEYGGVSEQEKASSQGDDEGTKITLESVLSGEHEKAVQVAARLTKPHMPGQNPILWCFHLLEGVTVVSSLCLLVTQVLPLFMVANSEIAKRIGILSLALKVYIALFCFLIIATEINVSFVQRSPLLTTYSSRGFLYSFLGLICVEEAYSERVRDIVAHGEGDTFTHVGWEAIFMQISSWLMLAVGCLYMLLGMCCMRRYRDRLEEREREEWRVYREEMKDWRSKYEK